MAGRRDDLIVMTTEYAFDEAERKLLKKSPESLGAFASLKPLLEMCPAPPSDLVRHVRWLIRDEKDRPIMAGAISAEADWLLTKDGNDFGHIYGVEVYGTLVTTPATGLYRFRQREGMP